MDGNRYIVETKGQEDVNVANKDRAAAIWCENASALTGENWSYLKVKQGEYTKLQADTFEDLTILGQAVLPLEK
jgi:type III restriction enzyme